MITVPTSKNISSKIEPNYSTWQTIELSYQCAKYAIDNNIQGDFVECGIACGNNLAAMCAAGRHGYGFDSFQGIPWAGEHDTEQPGIGMIDKSKIGILETSGVTSHSEESVIENFKRWGLENYSLVKGWFQDTLRYANSEYNKDFQVSVLRLDGDLYESTLVCLEKLYPQLSKGGILIIDDWNLEGCRKAFYDYFKNLIQENGETLTPLPNLILDNGVTYWQK